MEVGGGGQLQSGIRATLRPALPLAFALSCVLLLGCDALLKPDAAAARAWHDAQWAALAQAWAAGQDAAAAPATPRRPWGVGRAVPAGYSAVLAQRAGEAAAWQALEEDSRGQLRYCTELLSVLYQRDGARLAVLTGELEGRRAAQRAALADYSAARQRTGDAVAALRQAWSARCPAAADFDYDLAAAVSRARAAGGADAAQLRAYHAHHYARLVRRYLDWASPDQPPPADPGPAPAPPAEAAQLRQALQALEAALLARNALETQALADAAAMQRYAPADGRIEAQLPDLLPDQRRASARYRQPRVAVAQARLALFSRVDALLSPAEDVMQTAATREWLALWPDCDVETNIYAYAGLPERQLPEPAAK